VLLPTHLSKPGLSKAKAAERSRPSVQTLGRHGPALTKIRDPTIRDRRVFDSWLDERAEFISLRTPSFKVSRTEGTRLASAGEGPMAERRRRPDLRQRWPTVGEEVQPLGHSPFWLSPIVVPSPERLTGESLMIGSNRRGVGQAASVGPETLLQLRPQEHHSWMPKHRSESTATGLASYSAAYTGPSATRRTIKSSIGDPRRLRGSQRQREIVA